MLQREQELDGEFCVFYHFYNSAALIYEVTAEIARCAYGLPDKFAPLPRVQARHFEGSSLEGLKSSFKGMAGQDHNTEFRKLAISASPTLFSFGSEAPPLHCFRHGYGCGDVSFRGLLTGLLEESCSVNEELAGCVATELAQLASKFGLIGSIYGHGGPNAVSRLGGQMLQIFIRHDEVNKWVYHSRPYGIPIEATTSVSDWLAKPASKAQPERLDGQGRILLDPRIFFDPTRGRIYHYCGDWEFYGGSPDMEGSRAAFVLELRRVLSRILRPEDASKIRSRLEEPKDSCKQQQQVARELHKRREMKKHCPPATAGVVDSTIPSHGDRRDTKAQRKRPTRHKHG